MRAPGWEERLAAEVAAASGKSFRWGEFDCATWAFDVAAVLRGAPSFADEWRGKYKSARGALRIIRRLGAETMEEAVTARLGQPRKAVLLARRGDIVMTDADPLPALGVCVGANAMFLRMGGCGLVPVPLRDCVKAWEV